MVTVSALSPSFLRYPFLRWALLLFVCTWFLTTQPLFFVISLISLSTAAVLVLRWPWLGWLGLAVVLPVSSGVKAGALSLTELILAALLTLWFIDGVRRHTLHLEFSPLVIVLLGYIGALLLSLLGATNLGEGLAEVVKWIEVAVVLMVLRQVLPHHKASWLVAALLIGGMGQALLGLYQFVFRIGPDWFIILGRFMRASGSFSQPNPYAGYMGLCLPVAASLALWAWNKFWYLPIINPKPLVWALFYTAATVLIGLGLLASWSRGGWLGAVMGATIVVILRSRQSIRWGVIGAVAGTVLILLGSTLLAWIPAPVTNRLVAIPAYLGFTDLLSQPVTDENFAVIERLAHWVAALRMWEQAPWLGIGAGNYATLYPTVRIPPWEEPLGHAHNIYLNTLAETGLVGIGFYLVLWGTILFWLWQQRQAALQRQAHWYAALALGVLGVVGHITVHNFFDNLFVQGLYLQVAFWLAALHTCHPDESQAKKKHSTKQNKESGFAY